MEPRSQQELKNAVENTQHEKPNLYEQMIYNGMNMYNNIWKTGWEMRGVGAGGPRQDLQRNWHQICYYETTSETWYLTIFGISW